MLDITGHTALAVLPDVLNAKYHGKQMLHTAVTIASLRDPVLTKFKHVTHIETFTLLCCNHITLWKALDANMVETVLAALTKTSQF